MTFLIVLMGLVGYLMTGAFFCGLADDDWLWLWCWLWPIMLVMLALFRAAEYVSDLGWNIRDHFQSYFKRSK